MTADLVDLAHESGRDQEQRHQRRGGEPAVCDQGDPREGGAGQQPVQQQTRTPADLARRLIAGCDPRVHNG